MKVFVKRRRVYQNRLHAPRMKVGHFVSWRLDFHAETAIGPTHGEGRLLTRTNANRAGIRQYAVGSSVVKTQARVGQTITVHDATGGWFHSKPLSQATVIPVPLAQAAQNGQKFSAKSEAQQANDK